jgi:antitoxin (DNA-binding transcriptional repressor) of toxin-antitoxin stability system
MKAVEISKATAPLADYARDISGEPLVITENGKPIAILEALEDTDWETISLSSNPEFMAIIERSRTRQQTEGGLSEAEVRRRLGLPATPSDESK